MRLNTFAILGLIGFIAGCSRQDSNALVTIKVGVRDDGQAFFDWNGIMQFQTRCNGKVQWPSGATVNGSFRRRTWKSPLQIELTLKNSDDDRYTVLGTITSPVPSSLELLGTSTNQTDGDLVLQFPVGTNAVRFEGKLYFTYRGEKRG